MVKRKTLSAFEKSQLKMGKKIEMEHTSNPRVAKKIAMDHIMEFKGKPYYTKLVAMEKQLAKLKRRIR